MTDAQFGSILRRLRKQNHFTQRQLGHRLGVTDSAVSKWESGDNSPDFATLRTIAGIFGISVDTLLSIKPADAANIQVSPVCENKSPQTQFRAPARGGLSGNLIGTENNQTIVAEVLNINGEFDSEKYDSLTAQTLFGDKNYYHFLDRNLRGEMIFLLGVGWNTPFWAKQYVNRLDEIDPDPEKFGCFGDTPLKRLRAMTERIKEYGYGGLGLTIVVSQSNDISETEGLKWQERAKRCHQAGVAYLFIVYHTEWSGEYLQMVTGILRRHAPGMTIQLVMPWYRYLSRVDDEAPEIRRRQFAKLLPACDVIFTADTFEPFADAGTLSNADKAYSLNSVLPENTNTILNFSDRAYVGAILGGTITVFEKSPEIDAALGWQRLSPPFGVTAAGYSCSEEILEDSRYYDRYIERPWLEGNVFRIRAPAIMARGCELPLVETAGGITPYVAASRNPITGAYALGTFRRNIDPNINLWGLADITLCIDSLTVPIGLFGFFRSVRLRYTAMVPADICITAHDPAGLVAPADVTDSVTVQGDSIILDGKQLRHWGKAGWTQDSDAAPAIIIRFCRKK